MPADRIHRVLAQDWTHLIHTKKILDSPNYLREKGKPVVGLWGTLLFSLNLVRDLTFTYKPP